MSGGFPTIHQQSNSLLSRTRGQVGPLSLEPSPQGSQACGGSCPKWHSQAPVPEGSGGPHLFGGLGRQAPAWGCPRGQRAGVSPVPRGAPAETTAFPTRAWSVGLNFPDPPSRVSPAGRTPDENPEALRLFEGFVECRGLDKTEITHPAQAANGNVCLFLPTF